MPAVLQLVLLAHLAQTQHGLALPVQLVVEVVQQRCSRAALRAVHTLRLEGDRMLVGAGK